MLYFNRNEQRQWVKVIRIYEDGSDVPMDMPLVYQFLNASFPEYTIDHVAVVGEFSPSLVRLVSAKLHVPTGFMFCSSFAKTFKYTFTELGGLRIITKYRPKWYAKGKLADLITTSQELAEKKRKFTELISAETENQQLREANRKIRLLFGGKGADAFASFSSSGRSRSPSSTPSPSPRKTAGSSIFPVSEAQDSPRKKMADALNLV